VLKVCGLEYMLSDREVKREILVKENGVDCLGNCIFKAKIKTMDTSKLLKIINAVRKNTLMETLKITYTDVGSDFLEATMPVSPEVHQPMGLLHGGATAALAESVGSAASHMLIDNDAFQVRGIEITANHLKSVSSGNVIARACILHKGKTTHLWKIEVRDEQGDLISFCKLTNIVLPKSNK